MYNPFEDLQLRLIEIEKLLQSLLNSPKEQEAEKDQKLTRKEAAEYLNVTLPTLDRYRRENRLPSYQTGRTIYFKRNEIDNALSINPKKRRV